MKYLFIILGVWVSTTAVVYAQRPRESVLELPVKRVSSTSFRDEEIGGVCQQLGIVVGKPLDIPRIERKIKQLYGVQLESLLIEVEREQNELHVILSGNRRRRIRHLTFRSVDDETQSGVRARFGLSEGVYVDSRALSGVVEYLRDNVNAQGYLRGEVKLSITDVARADESDVEISVLRGEPTVVRSIQIVGVTGDDSNELRKILEIRKGQPLQRKDIEVSAEKIVEFLKGNQFPMAKVVDTQMEFNGDKSEVDISIQVTSGRRIQVDVRGNTVYDDRAIREMLVFDSVSDSESRRQIVEAIEGKYKKLGFHFCTVNVMDTQEEGLLDRRVVIEEGDRVIVDRVHLVGVGRENAAWMERDYFENASGVLQRRIYWEAGLEDARRNLEKALAERGYLKGRINSVKPVFSADKRGVQLFIEAETGIQSMIQEIVIRGNDHVSRSELLAVMGLRENVVYSPQNVTAAKDAVLLLYREMGYVDVQYELTEKQSVSADSALIQIEVTITEGVQYSVGDTSVSGNVKTTQETILREMKLGTGDIFVPSLLRRSEEDIGLLGIFSKVELTSHSNINHPDRKDIKITVVETRPGLGEVGVGATYEDPRFRMRSFLGLAYRNLFGKNHTVSFRGEIALPMSRDSLIPFIEYATVVGMRAPYPWKLPFVFNAQVGLDRFELSPQGPQIANRARLEERIERKLSDVTTVYFRLHRFERSSTQDLSAGGADRGEADVIGSTGPGLLIDLRDSVFNPIRGSYHTLDIEYAHPNLLSSERIKFALGVWRNSFYFPLVANTSLRLFVGFGYARTLDESYPVPKVRLLNEMSLGGPLSIRGFALRSFRPNENALDSGYYNVRAELVFGIFGELDGTLFGDTGRVFPNIGFGDRRESTERHDGVGIGFRYRTPVGPIVVDLAHGIGDTEAIRFYFTLGTI